MSKFAAQPYAETSEASSGPFRLTEAISSWGTMQRTDDDDDAGDVDVGRSQYLYLGSQ